MERRDFLKGLGASVLCFQLNLILITKRKVLFTKRKEFIPPPAELCVVRRESDRADVGFISPMAIVSVEYELDGSGTWTDLADATSPVTIPGLSPAGSYVLRLRSRDGAGNVSVASSPLNIATTDARTPILDSLSTATPIAAYGFSKLKASGGPSSCVRVINTTSSVQTDLGFDSSGNCDRTAALALFTAGQELEIITYYDLTGNGKHVTAVGTRHKLDLSGHRVCALTSTATSPNIRYQSSGTVDLVNPAMFFVADYYNYGQACILDFGGGNQMQTRNTGGTVLFTTKNLYMNNGSAITSTESVTYGTQGSDGIRQFTSIFQAGADRMRRDGIEMTPSGNAGDTARTAVQICLTDFNGGGGLGWTGKFYEAVIVDGTIAAGDITTVENDQINYYQNGKHVFCVGDSQSYGPTLSNIYTENYSAQIRAQLATAGITGWDVDSLGIAGATIESIESNVPIMLAPRIRSTQTKNVVIIDGYFNNSGTDTAATGITKMQSLVNTVRAVLNAGDEIWLRTCTRATGAGMDDAHIIAYNNLLVAGGVTGIDGLLDSTSDTHIGNTADTSILAYYNADAIHLTPLGYGVEATYALAAISF